MSVLDRVGSAEKPGMRAEMGIEPGSRDQEERLRPLGYGGHTTIMNACSFAVRVAVNIHWRVGMVVFASRCGCLHV